LIAMARGFRHWPIGHPQEFVLLFGTPVPGVAQMEEDCESPDHPGARLGAVFMAPFARLLVGWVRLYGVVALGGFRPPALGGRRRRTAVRGGVGGFRPPARLTGHDDPTRWRSLHSRGSCALSAPL